MIDTPELVFLIGQHLHPADLRRCIQVSQPWHETLIPCLWRELDDSERPWCQTDVDPRRLSEMIHKYGHHIRHLRITHIWTLECCLQANLNGATMLYWKIDIRECKSIHLDGPREVSIIQGMLPHLECEPDPYRVDLANEWDYVSKCFWALVCRNRNLTLVDILGLHGTKPEAKVHRREAVSIARLAALASHPDQHPYANRVDFEVENICTESI
ncbi:hypothetical protein BG003_002559 [Podila horticola]|nr:hypothetical protein BG003_002559 [Podila horticola]